MQRLVWWILLFPTINTSRTSIDLMQSTSQLFNNPASPTLQLSYGELRYLKQTLENYQFFRSSGKDTYDRGRGGRLVCVIMTHCVGKSICDSLLYKRCKNYLKHFFIENLWIQICVTENSIKNIWIPKIYAGRARLMAISLGPGQSGN